MRSNAAGALRLPGQGSRSARLDWPPERVAEQPLHRALGLTDWEFARIRELLERRAERLRARGLLGPLVGALRLQALGAAPAAPALGGRARPAGPGRERRRRRRRRRARGRVQGRVAQPSDRGRAVPGCGDRRRRDPPRHRRDGRAADRAARRAPLRRARLALPPRRRRASASTATASASRTSAARRSSTRPTPRTRSSTRCASACCPTERVLRGEGDRHRQPDRPLRRADRPRRDRRRLGAREPGSRGLGREAAVGPDRRPVPRQGADRGVARARRARARRRAAGLRRGRASPRRSPRWPRAAPASTSTSTGCRSASPTWSRGRS